MEYPQNSRIGGSTRAWGPTLGAFIAMVVLFQTSEPVGNFFDVERYFVAEVFLPAVVTLLALIIIRHYYDHNWIRYLLVAITAVASFWFASLGLQFASVNPEGPIYINAYLMDYNPILYSVILAGILNLLFYYTLDLVGKLRAEAVLNRLAKPILTVLCKKMLQAFLFAAIPLLSAQFIAVGAFYLILPLGIALPFLLPTKPSSDRVEGASSLEQTPSMNRRKAGVLCFAGAIVLLLVGFLWPVQYLRLLPSPEPDAGLTWVYFLVNPRLVLEDGLLTITIGVIILLGFLFLQRVMGQNLETTGESRPVIKLQAETRLLLILCVSLGLGFLWYSSGISFLGLRPANVLAPIWIICGLLWVITLATRQQPSPTGMLSALFLLGSLTFWAGFVIGIGAEEDYEWSYITMVLVIALLLLVVGTFLPEIRQKKQKKAAETAPAGEVSRRHHLFKFSTRHAPVQSMVISRPVQALALIGLVVAPAILFASGSVQSSANFRVLANVDDNCLFYLADPFNRVDQYYRPGFGATVRYDVNNTIQISAARNEFESIQIVMLPINQKHFSLYNIAFSGFRHSSMSKSINASEAKFQAYTVEYVSALSNKVPDILVPFAPLGVADGFNHPLWCTFYVPIGALEGDYTSNLTLTVDKKYGTGSSPQDVNLSLRLHVFNFTLPRQPTLQSNFGLSTPEYSARFNYTMQVFQDHRMGRWAYSSMPTFNVTNAGNIDFVNYTAMDECYNQYHQWETHSFGVHFSPTDLLVDSFLIGGINYTAGNYSLYPQYNDVLADYWSEVETHLKGKSFVDDLGRTITWYSETYYNGRDEVDAVGGNALTWAIGNYTWYKETLHMTIPIMQTMGDCAELRAVVDIICHHTGGLEPDYLHEWQASGKEAWIYTTCGPRFPGPSIQTGTFNLQVRALGWQTFIFNYTHYLIWEVQTPYNEANGFGYQGWNGGTLLYQAPNDSFYLSTRLENVREGFEDHDYFVLLNTSVQALKTSSPSDPRVAQGMTLQHRISALMRGYIPTMDYRAFEQLREDIGALLSDISVLK